jgi:hypothetical protein
MLLSKVLLQSMILIRRLGVLAKIVSEQQHFRPALTFDRYEVQLAAFARQVCVVRLGEVVVEPILPEPFHVHGHVRRVAYPDLDIDAVPCSKAWNRRTADVLDAGIETCERLLDVLPRSLVPLNPIRVIWMDGDERHTRPIACVPTRPDRFVHYRLPPSITSGFEDF